MSGRTARWRLAALVAVLASVALTVPLLVPFSAADLRAAVAPFGLLAPVAYVLVAAVLAVAFVPGPLLSAAGGALFGTGPGFCYAVLSAALTAVIALHIARRSGRQALHEVSGERARALAALARRRGTGVVVLQRLLPGVPDAPFSYLFGAVGLRTWQVALGTVVGSAPRGFSYTALGDAALTGDRNTAAVGVAVGVGVSLLGVIAGAVVVHRHRRRDQA